MNTTYISEARIVGITAGDVIEFDSDGMTTTGLVLLAADESMILDLCDDSTPLVVRYDEIGGFRRFSPDFDSLLSLAA
jgi:hypothetical protein